jgi:hypothetical protein
MSERNQAVTDAGKAPRKYSSFMRFIESCEFGSENGAEQVLRLLVAANQVINGEVDQMSGAVYNLRCELSKTTKH